MFNAMHMLRISQGFPKETVLRGVTAETFKEVFDKKVPDRVWEGKNAFLGKITKRTYYGK